MLTNGHLPAGHLSGGSSGGTGRLRRRAVAFLALTFVAVSASMGLTTRTARADYNDGVSRSQVNSNYDWGYWQDCADACNYFTVAYDWSGNWGLDEWKIYGPPYFKDLDYESNTTWGYAASYGTAINGKNESISIMPNQYIYECWSSRSDCGNRHVDYWMSDDSNKQPAGMNCSGSDACIGWQVTNLEKDGYVDPNIVSGACEWATGTSNAVPTNGICDQAGLYYDMGQ